MPLRTGQVGYWYYDVDKNYALVRFDNYATETQLAQRIDYRHEQVSGGAWFPVELTTTGFNIANGEKVSSSVIAVDLSKSAFNDPSAVPDRAFEFAMGDNAEVSDFSGGERLLYSTDVTPLTSDTINTLVTEFLSTDGKPRAHEGVDGGAGGSHPHHAAKKQAHYSSGSIPPRWLAFALLTVGVIACSGGAVMWIRRRSR